MKRSKICTDFNRDCVYRDSVLCCAGTGVQCSLYNSLDPDKMSDQDFKAATLTYLASIQKIQVEIIKRLANLEKQK